MPQSAPSSSCWRTCTGLTPETLTIIEYLADNLAAERLLCVATLRDEAASPALELTRSLAARRVSQPLELAPLDEEQVRALVASCLGSAAVPHEAFRLAAQADGVPFMVEELLAAALSAGALRGRRGRTPARR